MPATRKDVARMAGVSPAIVSYVVNNGPRPVSEKTRARVVQAIERLNYHPSAIARSLTTKKTATVGFIIPDILNPIHAQIAKTFEDAMRLAGYSVILCNSNEEPERELAYLNVLMTRQVDGIALTPTGENRALILSIVESGKPIVYLDRQIDGMETDCVLFDNEVGSYEAVRHLAERGHRRIGIINLPATQTPGLERLRGYRRALSEAGIEYEPGLVSEGSFVEEGAEHAASLLSMSPRPTAVFCSSNRLLKGLLEVAKARELKMPEELAVCAFDDVAYFTETTPSITAVSTSVAEFGSRVAQLLCERLSRTYEGEARVMRIPCELKIRESTVPRGFAGTNGAGAG